MRPGADGPEFLANHAGGIAGGISTGQPVVCAWRSSRPSSILTPVETITARAKRPNSSPRAATIPASAFAACRWSRR